MLKQLKPALDDFVENYRGSIRNKFTSAISEGKTKFIFEGPSGSGKTFLAEAAANGLGMSFEKLNLYVLENVNDEDVSSLIFSIVYNAAKSKSLFDSNKKLIYVEDIEKVLSVEPNILKKLSTIDSAIIIFESRTGEIFKAKNKGYVSGYEIVRFYKLNDYSITSYINKLASYNKIRISPQQANAITKNAKGSITSAFTDVETVSFLPDKEVYLPPRNAEDSIFEQINSIFAGNSTYANVQFSSDQDAKNFEIWLADKAPQVFVGERLFMAFEKLSYTDVLLNKIRKQNWSLLKYIKSGMLDGISSLSENRNVKINYSAPNWNSYYRAGR